MVAVDAKTLDASAGEVVVDDDLDAGTRGGEYVVEAKLGKGGFGAVYRAHHPLIGKSAAVKVLNRVFSADRAMVSRFVAEARAVNQIRHRKIIDIFAFGQLPDGRQHDVMELLAGAPPDQPLAGGKVLDLDAARASCTGMSSPRSYSSCRTKRAPSRISSTSASRS
jgi:serine/threonine protein kinase